MNRDYLAIILVFALSAALLYSLYPVDSPEGALANPSSTTSVVSSSTSTTLASSSRPEVFFFYSPSCPHCVREKAFLEGFEKENPGVVIHYLLASENPDEFREMAEEYNSSTQGVPRTFIGDKAFVGFSPEDCELRYQEAYKAYIGCKNQLEKAILA